MKTRVASNAYLLFRCPGCLMPHMIKFGEGPGPTWHWDGNQENPTVTPSLLNRRTVGPQDIETVCHLFITNGKLEFLSDCTHHLKGQTVEIPEWECEVSE